MGKSICKMEFTLNGVVYRCGCIVNSTQEQHTKETRWCAAGGNNSTHGRHALYYPKSFLRYLAAKGLPPDELAFRAILSFVLWQTTVRTVSKAAQGPDTWLSQLSAVAKARGVPRKPLPNVELQYLDFLTSTTNGNDKTKARDLKSPVRAVGGGRGEPRVGAWGVPAY